MSHSSSPAPRPSSIPPLAPARPPSAPNASAGNSSTIVVNSANGGTSRYRVLAASQLGPGRMATTSSIMGGGPAQPQPMFLNDRPVSAKLSTIIAPVTTKVPTGAPPPPSLPRLPASPLSRLPSQPLGSSSANSVYSASQSPSSSTDSHPQPGRPSSAHHHQQQQPPADDQTKCARFFKTLMNLSEKQNHEKAAEVCRLIKGVVFGSMQPENFTRELQNALGSAAKQDLLPFLRQTLPSLRESIRSGRHIIEGIGTAEEYEAELAATNQARGRSPSSLAPAGAIRLMRQQPLNPSAVVGGGLRSQQQQPHPQLQPRTVPLPPRTFAVGAATAPPPESTSATYIVNYPTNAGSTQLVTLSGARSTQSPNLLLHGPPPPKRRLESMPVSTSSSLDESINGVVADAVAGTKLDTQGSAGPKPLRSPAAGASQSSTLLHHSTSPLFGHQQGHQPQQPQDQRDLLLNPQVLVERIASRMPDELEEIDQEVLDVISNATESLLRQLLSRLALAAEHRLEPLRMNPLFSKIDDPRKQIRMLEEAEKHVYERRSTAEKEELTRVNKGKGKDAMERAKQMQRADKEAALSREANAAAMAALGGARIGTKRPHSSASNAPGPSQSASNNALFYGVRGEISLQSHKVKTKRVTMRDLQYVLRSDNTFPFRGKYLLYAWKDGMEGSDIGGGRSGSGGGGSTKP